MDFTDKHAHILSGIQRTLLIAAEFLITSIRCAQKSYGKVLACGCRDTFQQFCLDLKISVTEFFGGIVPCNEWLYYVGFTHKFYVEVFYVTGKALSSELSCTGMGQVIILTFK